MGINAILVILHVRHALDLQRVSVSHVKVIVKVDSSLTILAYKNVLITITPVDLNNALAAQILHVKYAAKPMNVSHVKIVRNSL